MGRYEVNPEKIDEIEAGGLEFVGRDESGLRMEIAEIPREHCHESTPVQQAVPAFELASIPTHYFPVPC